VKGEKDMAVIIRGKDLKYHDHYGKLPGNLQFGIYNETVENPNMVMGHTLRTLNPPGRRGRRHYHANCNVGMYRIKGHARYFIGPDHDMQEVDVGPGDFLFVPQGEIHGPMNISETEGPSELVFCYIGVNSPQEAVTIYVDPPSK
jgi:uncharacterized RmlC-like cupin family protein